MTEHCASPGSKLRQLMAETPIVPMPGLHDCLMAMLVERVGFRAAFVGDGAVSVSRLGKPDFGYVDRGDVVDRAREICRCTSMPMVIDIGTGYGNALNLQRTVSEIELAGAAGVFFEDQLSPKKCGHIRGRTLITREEMIGKIQAAADCRRDSDFVLIARTDALATEGFEAAVERCGAYAQAGADVVFIDALDTVEQLRAAPERIGHPMMVNMLEGGRTPYLSANMLAEMGYQMVIWPESLMYAGFSAMQHAAEELFQTGTLSDQRRAGMTDFTSMSEFLGLESLYELEQKYTGRA